MEYPILESNPVQKRGSNMLDPSGNYPDGVDGSEFDEGSDEDQTAYEMEIERILDAIEENDYS